MAVVVQKYGGSSVADVNRLRTVADLVARTRAAGHDVVVVVSAMGKTTQKLLDLAGEVCARTEHAGAEPSRRELDMLVSTGERVSMALLSIALHSRGCDAISFTGSQSGIITNDRHFDARIIEVRPHRIEDELHRGRIVIVAGYQGMSYKREITTLGRGGSDTTAVALAAALGAERCEIYSDVDGVYSADPRSVSDARHLPEIDYETLQEMAESGAKVLNARAVEWARRNRVKLHARRTADWADPDTAPRETVVGETEAPLVRAVVGRRDSVLLRVPAAAASALLEVAERSQLPLAEVSSLGGELLVLASLLNVPDFGGVERALREACPGIDVGRGRGSVSIVGPGFGSDAASLRAALELLPGPPEWVSSGPLRLTVVVPEAVVGEVEQAWHARFVSER